MSMNRREILAGMAALVWLPAASFAKPILPAPMVAEVLAAKKKTFVLHYRVLWVEKGDTADGVDTFEIIQNEADPSIVWIEGAA